jgi:hypothetical protein
MLPKWILIARAGNGHWQVLASVTNIREVQLVLKTMVGVEEAKLCRLADPIDIDKDGQVNGLR